MLLTEEEARRKWCPLARSLFISRTSDGMGAAGANRDMPDGMIPSCLASTCMAWRWLDPKKIRDIDLVTSDVVDEQPRRGYCGSFGQIHHGE